ncbi:uncharacterized protein [Euwallacea fornicatus]|uniref:uncharacterized protein n=1 Tax=Euwallacea fornicatus TaxID=995702 RepID=UPI00338FF0C6
MYSVHGCLCERRDVYRFSTVIRIEKIFIRIFFQFVNGSKWKFIEQRFRKERNFPGCCRTVDRRHDIIKAPTDSGRLYFNYKGTNSTVLMVLVNNNYFKYIDIGCNCGISDGGMFRQYIFAKALPETRLSLKEKVFNYRLSRVRRIVERTFGILISRFRIFEKSIPFSSDQVDLIILRTTLQVN